MPTLVNQLITQTSGNDPLADRLMTGSWAERLWHPADDHNTVIAAYLNAGPGATTSPKDARAALLSTDAVINAIRLQTYNIIGTKLVPTGGSRLHRLNTRGTWSGACDHPDTALELRMGFTGAGARITLRLAGIPDLQCEGGEFTPTRSYSPRVDRYLAAISAGWGSVIINRVGLVPQKIQKITLTLSGDGLVTGRQDITGFTVGQVAVVTRAMTTARRLRGGRYSVMAVDPVLKTITLRGWQWGATKGGTVYLLDRAWMGFDPAKARWEQIVSRKVGLPFDRFRGRSKRRLLPDP